MWWWTKPTESTPETLRCEYCAKRVRVVGTKAVNEKYDATEVYKLTCGHVVM